MEPGVSLPRPVFQTSIKFSTRRVHAITFKCRRPEKGQNVESKLRNDVSCAQKREQRCAHTHTSKRQLRNSPTSCYSQLPCRCKYWNCLKWLRKKKSLYWPHCGEVCEHCAGWPAKSSIDSPFLSPLQPCLSSLHVLKSQAANMEWLRGSVGESKCAAVWGQAGPPTIRVVQI